MNKCAYTTCIQTYICTQTHIQLTTHTYNICRGGLVHIEKLGNFPEGPGTFSDAGRFSTSYFS